MSAVPLRGRSARRRVRAAHDARERGSAAVLLVAVLVGGCVTGRSSPPPVAQAPRVILDAPTRVPIRIVQNITLVQATLDEVHRVTLIVDTGAQSTIVAPAVARRLGVTVSADGPRRQVSVVGGGKLDIPFVKISSLRVGDARIEAMEIGVFDVAPSAHGVHGLLGADFLHQFRITLDAHEHWLRLAPLGRQAQLGAPRRSFLAASKQSLHAIPEGRRGGAAPSPSRVLGGAHGGPAEPPPVFEGTLGA